MQPSQLVDMQVDLLRRLEQEDGHRQYLWRGVIEDLAAKLDHKVDTASTTELMADATVAALRAADVYRVAPDMVTLVQYAATQLDDEDVFDASLAPSGCGLVRFEVPLSISNVEGALHKVHWLLWGPAVRGTTLLYLWNDANDPDEVTRAFLGLPGTRAFGRWQPIMGFAETKGTALGPATEEPTPEEIQAAAEAGRPVPQPANFARIVHAFWLLCEQTIADLQEEHVRKTARRQAERLGIEARVTVVQLRRHSGSRGQGESQVEWTRRWVVKGHWRWQAHGPGRAQRRRIWIAPFIKGPEGAPLITSTKVYDLKR